MILKEVGDNKGNQPSKGIKVMYCKEKSYSFLWKERRGKSERIWSTN